MGAVSGTLAVWGVGGEGGGGGGGKRGPPTVSLQTELELDAGIFSLAFDHHMKLVGSHFINIFSPYVSEHIFEMSRHKTTLILVKHKMFI